MTNLKDITSDHLVSNQKKASQIPDIHSKDYLQGLPLPPPPKPKVIKRYQNRKFYDTQRSCYVTLDDIAKMIRVSKSSVVVIDNKTKIDITASVFTQIVLKAEKKDGKHIPVSILSDMIRSGDGSISSYLVNKLGIPHTMRKDIPVKEYVHDLISEKGPCSYNKTKPSGMIKNPLLKEGTTYITHKETHKDQKESETPSLPNSIYSSYD